MMFDELRMAYRRRCWPLTPTTKAASGEELLSERQLAAYLRVSVQMLRMASGDVPTVTIVDGRRMYRVKDVEAYTCGRMDRSHPLLLGVEVARMCGVNHTTLWFWRGRRKGPRCIRIGTLYRYHPKAVEAFLASYRRWKKTSEKDPALDSGRGLE